MTVTAAEWLDIAGVPLHTHAWWLTGLAPLHQGPPARGRDRRIPGAAGVRVKPRRGDAVTHSLPMFVFGHVDEDGVPYTDPREGLEANVEYLRANALDLTGGTKTATLHLPSGATRSGEIHVENFELSDLPPNAYSAVLTITIPAGALT